MERDEPVSRVSPDQTRQYSSLREWAHLRLREMIISGELAPGEDIHEGQLCARLNISKSPLREALRQLAEEGLVVATPTKGSLVAPVTAEDIREIYDLRYYLEALEVRLAAERIADEEIAALRSNIAAMEERAHAGDVAGFAEHDVDFHLALARISGNRRLLRMQESLQAQVRRLVVYQLGISGQRGEMEAVAWHTAIVDALEARDAARAEEQMRGHIRRGLEFRIQAVQLPPDGLGKPAEAP